MDINCDLGEGESLRRTHALMKRITSANIACGGHAGDEASMRICLALCRENKVNPGAHPGFEDRENFGRKAWPLTPSALRALLETQIFTLVGLTPRPLTHVKLHGALYHVVEGDARLARAFLTFMKEALPGTRIIALAEGRIVRLAQQQGVPVWGEIFAERGYTKAGGLIPRGSQGAVLTDVAEIRRRSRLFLARGEIVTVGGRSLKVDAGTICAHSDTPGAVRIADVLSRVFRA